MVDQSKNSAIIWCENNLIPLYDNLSYKLNEKGEIIVYGDVVFVSDFKELPVKIHEVFGSFVIDNTTIYNTPGHLKSLKNMPDIIHGMFDISHNKSVTSLVNGPKIVDGTYRCNSCDLHDLNGIAKEIGGSLLAYNNPITDISALEFSNVKDNIDINTMFESEIVKIQRKQKKPMLFYR